jgi:hypothetical protein
MGDPVRWHIKRKKFDLQIDRRCLQATKVPPQYGSMNVQKVHKSARNNFGGASQIFEIKALIRTAS